MKAICLGAALLVGAVTAQAEAQEAGSRQTRDFVRAADESDSFELMEAYSALAESRDPQVLAFARQMIHDHGETMRAMNDAATRAGFKPPAMAVGASEAPFLATLQSARGPEFDKVYWMQQALAHRAALITEQQYAANGDTPAVRQAAAAAIQVIQSHLATAERMNAMGGS